jgi:hypothetical protein
VRETIRKNLTVDLDENEVALCAKELARITTQQAELEEEKKAVTSGYKEKLDRCIMDARVLARKISTRKDLREVECAWRYDYQAMVAELYRLDTYELVESRRLTQDEVQMKLDDPADDEWIAEAEAQDALAEKLAEARAKR